MIGYCAIASSGIEIRPIRQMKRATTQAKIGRSIKKLGIGAPLSEIDGLHRRPFRPWLQVFTLMDDPDHPIVRAEQYVDPCRFGAMSRVLEINPPCQRPAAEKAQRA